MYYIGFLKNNVKDVVVFRSNRKLSREDRGHFVDVDGPYETEERANKVIRTLQEVYGVKRNPATSERQRRFMCAELGRVRSGKKTRTGMREGQLRDFCRKHNPPSCGCKHKVSASQVKRGTLHEMEHTKSRTVARKIAMDHLKEDPYYYTHLAKMEKQYKRNPMTAKKAVALTKKIIAYSKDIYKDYKENPGEDYHHKKFNDFMAELGHYPTGSVPYIDTLARAYEHLESAKQSIRMS